MVDICSPVQWLASSIIPLLHSLIFSLLIICSSSWLKRFIRTHVWLHGWESSTNSMRQCCSVSRIWASDVSCSHFGANCFSLPALKCVMLTRGKESPLKDIRGFLTSVVFNSLTPSLFLLFDVSDSCWRGKDVFLKKALEGSCSFLNMTSGFDLGSC